MIHRLAKAALNGGRIAEGVPSTPAELARDAAECIKAGAFAVHIHPRNRNGRESLDADDVANAVSAVRVHCSVGVTTGAWITSDVREAIARWTVLPDFASVNMDEPHAVEIANDLLARGVAIEAGLATVDAAAVYVASGLRCIRILVEPQEQNLEEAKANVARIMALLDANDRVTPRLLHGTEATAWPLLRYAQQLGYQTRIGFEDVLTLPDGTRARSNRELVLSAAAARGR